MPQISKIRIANFQYNDGKRLIADELYDFESENGGPSDVLINLANGGGKSVLVQLMMQPIIPKAKVAGRRIESFFKKASDHCYVALEWTLDNSRMKLMTGIAMSASDASGDSDSERGFQIKYYTFISCYQNYQGNYNIIAIPLSRRENGKYIPAAFDEIRNLAKKSNGGLERYASDDSVKWQERLAQYGIVQNEWRMIEELNSNEDGLSKYFSSLKSSDTVIDKLIIPRIEEKQNHSASKDDSSLETMLISYAKQFSRQQDIIKERDVCSRFNSMLEQTGIDAEELWKGNDSFEKCVEKLFAYSDALLAEIDRNRKLAESIETERKHLGQDIKHIEWEKVSAEYYTCKEDFDRKSENLISAVTAKNEAADKANEAEKHLLLIESAYYYSQLKDIESKITAITSEINDRENNSEDGKRLASLKYSACIAIKAELERVTPGILQAASEKTECNKAIDELSTELDSLQKNLQKAKSDADKAEAVLDKQREEDTALVNELGIDAIRMFDGKYQEDDLHSWQKEMQAWEASICKDIDANAEKLKIIESRIEAVPQEIADTKGNLKAVSSEADESARSLDKYRTAENNVRTVIERNGLDYELRFTSNAKDYLDDQIAAVRASYEDESRKIEATEEAIAAVRRGTLHIPKLLSDFLDAVGLHYTTFEKYLLTQLEKGLLSEEACQQLLIRYPYAAYGVIVGENERELLYQEAEDKWLPAVLPVFTASDVEKLLSGETEAFSAVAAYSQKYFSDSSAYETGLKDTLKEQNEYKVLLKERERNLLNDKLVIESFANYDDAWESRTLSEINKLKKNADEMQAHIADLQTELTELKKQKAFAQSEDKRLNDKLHKIRGKFSGFEKLLNRLDEEDALSGALAKAKKTFRELQNNEKTLSSQKNNKEGECRQLEARITELAAFEKALKDGYDNVAGADEADLVSDAWDNLLSQYKALLEAQNADLKRLSEDKKRLLNERQEKQKEIEKRNCDKSDYEQLVYSEEAENEAIKISRSAEKRRQEAVDAHTQAYHLQGKAESAFDNAVKMLADFGGEALPAGEIGNNFESRIDEKKLTLAELGKQENALADILANLQKAQGKAETAAENYNRPVKYNSIELEADYSAQFISLKRQIREWQDSVSKRERKVEESLRKMAETYGTASADVNLAISSMRELLSNEDVRGDRYYTLCEHIEANIHTARLRISQIDTDLQEFHKTKDDLVHQCVIQGKQMYEGLMQLSNNSKVSVQGRRRQMLKFDIPDAVDENVAIANISAEIDKGTNEIVAGMADGACSESDIRKTASGTVGSRRLLRRYINADNIVLKAFKIDRNPDNSGYRTWEQTQVNNSGAEKFVVYFAVILALMAYTRDGCDDMGGKNKSVLVLDNPFGPISSRHVLEPMFEISRNYNVQMICLSDISKSDIVSCFDLVIRAVVKQFALSSKEQLTHEGNETIEHGFYRSEQLSLF